LTKKIVVAGYSNDNFALARYNYVDGSLDNTFSGDGKVTTDFGAYDHGHSVAINQLNGKIVVAGDSNDDFAVAQYDKDGLLDNAFSSDGKVTTTLGGKDYGKAVAIQSDEKNCCSGIF
jgi:uncharacterized delta-60 repeat protein